MSCLGSVRSVCGVGGVGRLGGGSVMAVGRWGLSVVGRWSVSVVCGVIGQSVGSVGWSVGRSAVCMVGRRLWGRSVCWKVGLSVSGRSVGRVGRSVWVGRSVCSGSDGGQLEGLR